MQSKPYISIVIPTQESRSEKLMLLLRTIKNQKYDTDQYETTVVSFKHSKKINDIVSALQMTNLKYIQTKTAGVNRQRNNGFTQSTGSVIVFLDDDCSLPTNTWLKNISNLHKNNPEITGYGGKYLWAGRGYPWEIAYHKIAEHWLHFNQKENRANQLFGGNCSYKSNIFANFLFDENVIFGGTEEGLNQNLRLENYQLIFNSDHNVQHHIQLSFTAFMAKAYKQGIGSGSRSLHGKYNEITQFKELVVSINNLNEKSLHRSLIRWCIYLYDFSFWIGFEKVIKHKSGSVAIVQIIAHQVFANLKTVVSIQLHLKLQSLNFFVKNIIQIVSRNTKQVVRSTWLISIAALRNGKNITHVFLQNIINQIMLVFIKTAEFFKKSKILTLFLFNWILWHIFWPLCFPLRKTFYFLRYQKLKYAKKIAELKYK